MIQSQNWTAPKDYKVYCFNGIAKFVMVCIGRENDGHPRFCFFDKNWNEYAFSKEGKKLPSVKIDKPSCIDELFEIAEKLSQPFPFVRADFYVCNDKIYFGELTFTPAGGLDTDYPEDIDIMLGKMIKLPDTGC